MSRVVLALVSACFAGALATDARSETDCSRIADDNTRLACFNETSLDSSTVERTPATIFTELDASATRYIEGRGFSGLVLDGCQLTSFYTLSDSDDYILHEILRIDLSNVAGLGAGRGRAEDIGGIKFEMRSSSPALRVELTSSRGVGRDVTPEWADQLEQMLAQAVTIPDSEFEALIAADFPSTVLSKDFLMQTSVTFRYFEAEENDEILREFAELVQVCRIAEPTTAPPEQASAKFEPERGTDLRKSLLAAIRPLAENAFDPPIEFLVDTLEVSGDIAFGSVRTQRPGGAQISFGDTPAFRRGEITLENGTPGEVQALLRWNGTSWQVARAVLQPTEAWWLEECAAWGSLFPQQCSASQQEPSEQSSSATLEANTSSLPVARAVVHDVAKPVANIQYLTSAGFVPNRPSFEMPRISQFRSGAFDATPLPALNREAAASVLKDTILGGWYIEPRHVPVSRDLRIADGNIAAVAGQLELLVRATDNASEQAALSRINDLIELKFEQMPSYRSFDPERVKLLRFFDDLGYRTIRFWRSGEASSDAGWVNVMVFDLGELTESAPATPAIDPQGILIGLVRVKDIVGIFETGATAEVEFTLSSHSLPADAYANTGTQPSSVLTLDQVIAKASQLGLPVKSVLTFPSNGDLVQQRIDMQNTNHIYTAIFRRFDDGWRFWKIN